MTEKTASFWHNTEQLIPDVKNGQAQINASFENLFIQLKNLEIQI